MIENGTEGKPSKSQLKRDMHAMQELAAELSTLSDKELCRLGIGSVAISALAAIRPMRASGARKRQIKYAAKLLRNEDITAAQRLFVTRDAAKAEANSRFRAVERWRDRLLEQGDTALCELLEQHPNFDRRQLRQLIRGAQRERDLDNTAVSARKLFRLLRDELIG